MGGTFKLITELKRISHLTEPYLVNVVTLSGQTSQFFVRTSELVADLKEKVTLSQGIPTPEQRLVFLQNELQNESSLGSCGVGVGATVHLVLIASAMSSQTTSYFSSMISPSLSITHFTLGLGLDRLTNTQRTPHQPPRIPLPPHISHIVHLYDVPAQGFKVFVKYLYSMQLVDDSNGEWVLYIDNEIMMVALTTTAHLLTIVLSSTSILAKLLWPLRGRTVSIRVILGGSSWHVYSLEQRLP